MDGSKRGSRDDFNALILTEQNGIVKSRGVVVIVRWMCRSRCRIAGIMSPHHSGF